MDGAYRQLSAHFASDDRVYIAQIDADRYASIRGPYGIGYYPTLKFFHRGSDQTEEYQGGHDFASMRDFIERRINRK